MIHAPSIKDTTTEAISRANHERTKYELRKRGYSFAQVATRLQVSASAVTAVSLGTQRSKRIEEEIATLLDQPLEKVFPDRYDAH